MFILNISKIFKLSNSNQEFICKRHSDNSSHVRQVNVQWWLSLFFPSPTYKYSKRRSTCMCQKQYEAKQRPRKKIYFASLITAVPRRRAGMPESWVPLTLVQSEQWYRWCTPTGPGSCCWHPSHLAGFCGAVRSSSAACVLSHMLCSGPPSLTHYVRQSHTGCRGHAHQPPSSCRMLNRMERDPKSGENQHDGSLFVSSFLPDGSV